MARRRPFPLLLAMAMAGLVTAGSVTAQEPAGSTGTPVPVVSSSAIRLQSSPSCCANAHVYKVIELQVIPNYVDRGTVLARCTTLSGEMDCSISETVTTSAELGLALGATYDFVSSQLSAKWSVSQAVAVTCGRRQMDLGKSLVAYRQGTRYTYRISRQDAYAMYPPTVSGPLSAFEPSPSSVACQVV